MKAAGSREPANKIRIVLNGLKGEDGIAVRAGHHCAGPLMEHLGVTATCRAISSSKSTPSSRITTTDDIMRACKTSHLPMSTSLSVTTILRQRERIKRKTIENRRLRHRESAA